MPTIRVSDNLGLDLKITPDPGSAIAKYLRNASLELAPAAALTGALNVTLDQAPFQQFSAGLAFKDAVEVGAGDSELTIAAGATCSLGIYQKGSKIAAEHYRAPVTVPDGQAYIGLGVRATVSPAISNEINNLSFGFKPGAEIALYNFKPFATRPSAPKLADALAESIKQFSIPGDVEDLHTMPVGTVASVDGSGTLTFSVDAELAQSTSLYASPNLPLGLAPVKVKAGGSLSAGVSYGLHGEYEIRVRKIDDGRVEIGYYNKLGASFDISASASYGVSVTQGKTEVIPALLRLLSPDPKADEEALAAAGLKPDKIDAIGEAIEAGVDRALAAAVTYEFNSLRSDDAAFLYEVRLNELTAEGRKALHRALDGDLSLLTRLESELDGQGIRTVRTITTNLRSRKHTFKINLLGIYNAISISELVRTGEVLYDAERGGLVITDSATAKRIRASMVNFAADGEKLRHVLAEDFLITAAYRASRPGEGPELSSSHTFFEYSADASRRRVMSHVRAMDAVGLRANATVPPAESFGRCMFVLDADYSDEICTRLFLHQDGTPRDREEYESIGRKALASLIDANDIGAYRLEPLTNGSLWSALRGAGSAPAIRAVLPPSLKDDDIKPQVIASDYILIAWWAETMHSTGEVLARLREYQRTHPDLDPENNDFKKLRKRLADHLADVARKTKEHFSDPWGLVAMDMASGRQAELTARLTSAQLTLAQQRVKAIPAGGGQS